MLLQIQTSLEASSFYFWFVEKNVIAMEHRLFLN